jgi:hypothetical protein
MTGKINFTIGCDPEIFLKDRKYGSYKSAVGLIGGSKWEPKKLDKLGNAILEDNVAVEFNIQPANDSQSFRSHITKVLNHLREILPGYEFDTKSAVFFPKEELNTPQAQEFGCEPDFDAWRMCENQKPQAEDATLRSAGGHIHIGSDLAKEKPTDVIKAMDLFAGVESIKRDPDTLRRQLYGKAGCFRFKPYGVEYRTLSNFWIFSEEGMEWAYNQTEKALQFVANGSVITPEDGFIIQRCINTSNLNDYEYLAKTYGLN